MAKGTKTGGRKAGTPNKQTAARKAALLESGLSPLDYMLSVLRDENQTTETRLTAARSAAGYVHPALKSVEVGAKDGGKFVVEIVRFGGGATA